MQSIVNVLISALLLSIQSISGIRTQSPAPYNMVKFNKTGSQYSMGWIKSNATSFKNLI